MVKAVVFDLDDTLISEREYIESGFRHIASILEDELGCSKEMIYNDMICLFNEDPKYVFNRLLDKYGNAYTEKTISNLVEEYRNHYPNISFYADVIPCINYLRSKNIRLGIITDGYAIAQRLKLKAVNAHEYFEEIIVTDELGREFWKPHPRAFELMREKLNVSYCEMAYVGDNPAKDFYISSIYPVRTIQINRQGIYKELSYFRGVKADLVINNLFEIVTCI